MLARGLPGTGFFRTLYVLPWICAPLAIAVLWRWILAPTDGAASASARSSHRVAHRSGARAAWSCPPSSSGPTFGYVTLFFLAGILAIP